jgi:hypothetical protein
MPDCCAFCGRTKGPFVTVEGVFPVLSCVACLAQRSKEPSPYPELSDAELRAGLDQLPTWVLEQKAAANRRVVAEMGERLARASR